MAVRPAPYFTPETFKFLRALARNNRRDWFHAHKEQYETYVRSPCLRLIEDLAEPLRRISPELVASSRLVGGSLFRIHRDTRFAGDKSPYKTNVGMSFYHRVTKATARGIGGTASLGRLDAPGLYLHVEPGESFAGGGLWHPQPATLKRIRDYLIDNPRSWKAITTDRRFRAVFELTGDTLTRPPRGYSPTHELIADLKRKDFVTGSALSDEDLKRPDLLKVLVRRYGLMKPLLEYLCGALELEF
jgi:uncharacterized protein (TIGR02453 family)